MAKVETWLHSKLCCHDQFHLLYGILILEIIYYIVITSSGFRSVNRLLICWYFSDFPPGLRVAPTTLTSRGIKPGPARCDGDAQPAKLSRS